MVKYRNTYFDIDNNQWRVDLSTPSYTGDPIIVNTTEFSGCTISYSGSEDPFEPIITSSAKFTILKHENGMIDVQELKDAGDMDFTVDVYKNGVLEWTGYLMPDGVMEYYQDLPYDVELTATDGLKLLQGKEYSTNNWLLPEGFNQRCMISYIRDAIFKSDQLNKPLPIRWVGTLKNFWSSPGFDAFTQMVWSPRGEGYTDFNGNTFSTYFILENWLRATQCRMYQAGGRWRIERIPDIADGVFDWQEIDTTYSPVVRPTLTSGTETRIQTIGGPTSDFKVDNGAYTINYPGVQRVVTTYDANVPENIVPNGGFDNGLFGPRYWYSSHSDLQVEFVDSINGREGYSAQLTFPANSGGSGRTETFSMRDATGGADERLPIDTKTMYKRMNFGFTFMPLNGFPYDTNGDIQFGEKPFRFRVELMAVGGITNYNYCLNENGFWIPKPTGITFNRDSSTIVSESPSVLLIKGTYSGDPIVGDYVNFGMNSTVQTTVYCPQQFSNDLQGFLDYVGQQMVDDPNNDIYQYAVLNDGGGVYTLDMRRPNNGVNLVYGWGLSNSERDGSIALLIDPVKVGDVVTVNFDKFQGIKLPDFSEIEGYTHALLNIWFYVKQGQRYTLDDVYIYVDDNDEVYDYEYSPSKFTDKQEYTLRIGSSTNGFYASNVQDGYENAYLQKFYEDADGYVDTLPGMTSNTILKFRNKSLTIFEGTLLGNNVSFGGLYTIENFTDKKFLPLSMSYNTETSETSVSLVEMNKSPDSGIVRKFYGSNDKPLSNEIIN